MNPNRSDFTLIQCREALADFDHSMVEQAVAVMTSNDSTLVRNAARDPELGRAVFWIREWMAVERIQSKSEALSRLRVLPAIRRERKELGRFTLTAINAGLASITAIGQSVIWFTA